jgi:hypothetical protein
MADNQTTPATEEVKEVVVEKTAKAKEVVAEKKRKKLCSEVKSGC